MYHYMYDDRLRMLTCIISQTISLRERERERERDRQTEKQMERPSAKRGYIFGYIMDNPGFILHEII